MRAMSLAAAFLCGMAASPFAAAAAQTPAPAAAPRQTGTVKDVHPHDFVLTTATGDVTVTVPAASKILLVTPDVKKLSDAPAGGMQDLQPGDRASVVGTIGDTAPGLTATRVLIMKSSTVSAVHAADTAAWAQGAGGIVKSVSGNAISLSSGMKTVAVETTPSTIVRRYAPGSVNFADATGSTVAAIQPGDQLRVRGAKSGDGESITADEIVSGNFKNYSGTIASIDAAAATVSLKDLTTRKTVVVAITAGSEVKRIPAQMATMFAARMRGGQAGAPGAGAGEEANESGANRPAGEAAGQPGRSGRPAGSGGAGAPGSAGGNGGSGSGPRPGGYGGAGGGYGAPGGGSTGRAAGADLSRMLSRLPTETLGGLKQGDAVMIVATAPSSEGEKATAITLLAGVEAILAAPAGQSTQLSPWNMGGGGEGEAGGGGMGGGPQ